MAKHYYAQTYLGVLFKISLEECGFLVSDLGRYIIAEKGEERYMIQKVCRFLGDDGFHYVSTPVCAKRRVVEKLEKDAKKEGFIPAIAFGVCKQTYSDVEIIIVSTELWRRESKPPYLSETKNGYFFNYTHVNEGDSIKDALIHTSAIIQQDVRCRK